MYSLPNQRQNQHNSASQQPGLAEGLHADDNESRGRKLALVTNSRALMLLANQSQQLRKTINNLQQSNYFITSFEKTHGDKLWLQEVHQAKQHLLHINLQRQQLNNHSNQPD